MWGMESIAPLPTCSDATSHITRAYLKIFITFPPDLISIPNQFYFHMFSDNASQFQILYFYIITFPYFSLQHFHGEHTVPQITRAANT